MKLVSHPPSLPRRFLPWRCCVFPCDVTYVWRERWWNRERTSYQVGFGVFDGTWRHENLIDQDGSWEIFFIIICWWFRKKWWASVDMRNLLEYWYFATLVVVFTVCFICFRWFHRWQLATAMYVKLMISQWLMNIHQISTGFLTCCELTQWNVMNPPK